MTRHLVGSAVGSISKSRCLVHALGVLALVCLASTAAAKAKAKARAGAKQPATAAPAKAAPAVGSGESATSPATDHATQSTTPAQPAAAGMTDTAAATAITPTQATSSAPATPAPSGASSSAPTAAPPPDNSRREADSRRLGITAGAKVAYASPSSIIDDSGKGQSIPSGTGLSFFVTDLTGDYAFADSALGLSVGLAVPIVRNSISFASSSRSSTGLGEPSFFVGSRLEVVPGIEAGGRFRFKAGTASTSGVSRGSGFHNVQLDLFGRSKIAGVGVELDAGYLLSVSSGESIGPGPNSVMVDPGDFLSFVLAADYPVNEMITPRLSLLFANSGGTTYDGTALPGTGARWLAVALDVNIRIDERFSAQVGWGSPMTALGYNLPYGFVLLGKNTPNGWLALNAGMTARL